MHYNIVYTIHTGSIIYPYQLDFQSSGKSRGGIKYLYVGKVFLLNYKIAEPTFKNFQSNGFAGETLKL